MKYQNIFLAIGIVGMMFLCGCGESNLADDADKDSTTPQSEVANPSDRNENSVSNVEQTSSENESEAVNYEVVSETYSNGKINIEYPQIKGLNTNEEKNVNKSIKDLIYNQESYEDFDPENENVDEKFEIKSKNKDFVSILAKGYSYREGGAHPYNYVKTYNIDLSKGSLKRLVDTGKTSEYAARIANGTGFKIKGEDSLKQEFKDDGVDYPEGFDLLYRKGYLGKTQDEIKKMLDNYDVDVNNPNSISQGYSYYENGKTVISIEVIHALGDYFEIVFD